MARKTKTEAEATREAILEAAVHVFVEKGVANASLEEIATRAGVTRGAVYWHFKNKCDVFAALHDQLFVSFSEMILHELEKNHPHPLQQLKEICIQLLLDLETNQRKKDVLTIFFLKCDYSGEMEKFIACQKEKKLEKYRLFAEYFRRAIEKGDLPNDADPEILTRVLTCYITGLAYEYLRHPELFNLKKNASTLIEHFFTGFSSGGARATL